MRRITLGIIGLLILLSGWYFYTSYYPITPVHDSSVTHFYTSVPTPTMLPTGGKLVLVGVYICLPHKDKTAPQTDECSYGMKAQNGFNYALSMGESVKHQFQVGKSVTARGLVVPLEAISSNHWYSYDIKGVMQVESLTDH